MYRRSSSGLAKHIDFLLWDMACLLMMLVVCYEIRNGFRNTQDRMLYINTALVTLLIDILVAIFGESYKGILKRGKWKEMVALIRHNTYVMVGTVFYLFITQNGQIYSRMIFILHWISCTIVMYLVRIAWKKQVFDRRTRWSSGRSMLVLCSNRDVKETIHTIRENEYGNIHLTGVILTEADRTIQKVDDIPVVASGKKQALSYIKKNWVDEIFIKVEDRNKEIDDFIDTCMEMGVTVHVELARLLNANKQVIEKVAGYTVLSSSINIATTKQLVMKRMLDICGGLVGVLCTGVLFVLVAPIIYLKSPGPIFFSQERVGKNGRRFKLYKFRSMYQNAEAQKEELLAMNEMASTLMFKMDDDPRIIGGEHGIGGFIRRTSIDEFPQFWNVLKGEMSLVGTRPPTVDEWEQYEYHHRKRLSTKPGITGMWQVSGRSNIKDFEEVVKLDTEYINGWTFGLDLRILFKTVKVVLKRDGSV